jgi:lysophospholipase
MSRALALALLLLGLAACRDEAGRAPFVDSRTPPDIAERFFPPAGWAWGLVQSGLAPPQRYGVSSAPGVPKGQVLIITGEGETAEAWFETVRNLNDAGLTVWVLERAGQAGSGRFSGPRDRIHAPSFDPDVAAVRAMMRLVIRPYPLGPTAILAHGDGAVVALRAAERGVVPDRLVLSAPRFAPDAPATPQEAMAVKAGFTRTPATGVKPWRRDGADGMALGLTHDPWRGKVQRAWQAANPDLRMSGPSIGWRQAFREAGDLAAHDAGTVQTPILMLLPQQPDARAVDICAAAPACETRSMNGARPALHLESDVFRKPWLDAAIDFVAPAP